MRFIFKKNRIRTVFYLITFLLGAAIVYHLITSFNGGIKSTLGWTLLICILLTTSGSKLWEMYGGFEGNWAKYRLESGLTKTSLLSSSYEGESFVVKKYQKLPIFLLDKSQSDIEKIELFASGVKKYSLDHGVRVRKLSALIRFWLKNQKKKKVSTSKLCRNSIDRSPYTYAVDLLTADNMRLSKTDIMSTVVDQKLLARKLMLKSTEIYSSNSLVQMKNDRLIIELPQKTDLVTGLYMHVLFVSADQIVVPDELIESRFLTYYEGNCSTQLLEFCKEQIAVHVKYKTVNEVELLGISLNEEDMGAPTLVCCAELRQTYEELETALSEFKINTTPPEAIPVIDYINKAPVTIQDAVIAYYVHKRVKEEERTERKNRSHR